MKQIKIARIVTIPEAFVHIIAFLNYLKKKDVQLTLIASNTAYKEVLKTRTGLELCELTIKREISLFNDVMSLLKLSKNFIQHDYEIVHSSTPKAGLITAMAGYLTGRRIRIHTFTGQRWATLEGFKRTLLKTLDRLIIRLNSQCYADSHSQIEYLIAEGVAKPGEVKCINLGSYGGVDTNRFDNQKNPDARKKLLVEIEADESSILILYVGRITKDKGIEELVEAFKKASLENNKLELILVGPYESQLDALSENILKEIKSNKKIHALGFKTNPEFYFSGADIFCLPSYREGFGTVILEAAACGLPSIGTIIPGLVDSIVDNVTGLLVEKKNSVQLKEAIVRLAADDKLRAELARNARERARKEFDAEYLSQLQWEEYARLLKKHS